MKSAKLVFPLLLIAVALIIEPRHVALKAAETQDWVPYTAIYSESVTNPGQPTRTLVWTEQRASDGSQLSIEQEGERNIGGKLWRSSGQLYSLDFNDKTAIYKRNAPRMHLTPHSDATGSMTIANVGCTLYPVKVENGTGSVCIDLSRDILVREEIQTEYPQGRMDYVRELVSIDYSKPSENQPIGFPAGFKVLAPTQQ